MDQLELQCFTQQEYNQYSCSASNDYFINTTSAQLDGEKQSYEMIYLMDDEPSQEESLLEKIAQELSSQQLNSANLNGEKKLHQDRESILKKQIKNESSSLNPEIDSTFDDLLGNDYENNSHNQISDIFDFQDPQIEDQSDEKQVKNHTRKIQNVRKLGKKIKKQKNLHTQNYTTEQQSRSCGETKKKGYETKNFLPAFKNSHLAALENFLSPSQFRNNKLINEIASKDSISMLDYKRLYVQETFHECWVDYFAKKQIYLDFMNSRVSASNRIIFSRKIGIFEKSFEKKDFNRIN